jgi:hypothetical protein
VYGNVIGVGQRAKEHASSLHSRAKIGDSSSKCMGSFVNELAPALQYALISTAALVNQIAGGTNHMAVGL